MPFFSPVMLQKKKTPSDFPYPGKKEK